jgi:hypothetical protein
VSRPKPKRSRSKAGSRPEAVTAAIAGITPKCNATIVELPNGPLILIACPAAAGCPRCDQGLPGGGGARRRCSGTAGPRPERATGSRSARHLTSEPLTAS